MRHSSSWWMVWIILIYRLLLLFGGTAYIFWSWGNSMNKPPPTTLNRQSSFRSQTSMAHEDTTRRQGQLTPFHAQMSTITPGGPGFNPHAIPTGNPHSTNWDQYNTNMQQTMGSTQHETAGYQHTDHPYQRNDHPPDTTASTVIRQGTARARRDAPTSRDHLYLDMPGQPSRSNRHGRARSREGSQRHTRSRSMGDYPSDRLSTRGRDRGYYDVGRRKSNRDREGEYDYRQE